MMPGCIPPEVAAKVGRHRLGSLRPVIVGGCIVGYRERPPRKLRRAYPLAGRIIRDVERAIRHRHGGPCDTDDGGAYLILAANAIVHCSNARGESPHAARAHIVSWAERWTPMVEPEELAQIADRAAAAPRKFRADAAAKLIRLTASERKAANVVTIGAIDMPKRQRTRRRKARKRQRDRERQEAKRWAEGRKPRDKYESESKSRTKPWTALGIGRSRYYEHGYHNFPAAPSEIEAAQDKVRRRAGGRLNRTNRTRVSCTKPTYDVGETPVQDGATGEPQS